MDFTVVPGQGVGPLLFNITRDAVHKALGQPDLVAKQNQYEDNTFDAYQKLGIVVHYDKNNKLDLVEFNGPQAPTYNGTDLLKVPDPTSWLEKADEDADINPPNLKSDALNLAFYLPNPDTRCVGVFAPDYYEE